MVKRAGAQILGWRWTVLGMVASLAFLAQFVRVGADWEWLVALGNYVRASGSVPDGVPYAAADTAGWHNVPVLGEIFASAWRQLGGRGALVHLAVTGIAMVFLAAAARSRGSSDRFVGIALASLVFGALSTLGVVRAQSYSFIPFAVLLGLLCQQARRPTRAVWWVVPLVVVWGNLHGAVLIGVCVLGAYLLADRVWHRPGESVAVGLAALVATCVTPQLWLTPFYYREVFDNVSAERGEGLWAPLTPGSPFDVLMMTTGALLLVAFLRRPRALWEYVAVLGLLVATLDAARHGVWLLFLLVVVSGGREQGRDAHRVQERAPDRLTAGIAPALTAVVALAVALPIAAVRGDAVFGAPHTLVSSIREVSGSRVVLAPAPLSEYLATAGVKVWASNPLDAFSHQDQAAYLDFIDGNGGGEAIAQSDVVVAEEGSAQADLVSRDPSFVPQSCGDTWICFVRS